MIRLVRRDEGFTLIELIVASLIGAILMAALVGVVRTGYAAIGTANDVFRGDDDVQTALAYLTSDVHATTRDPALVQVTTIALPGDQLLVGIPDVANARFVRVTYRYDGAAGTLTRTVDTGAGAPTSKVVARHLDTAVANVFSYCPTGAGCPAVTATIPFRVRGAQVVRTLATPLYLSP